MAEYPIRYSTIDDCLGPGQERFFAHGYRRVQHGLGPLALERNADTGEVTAVGSAMLSFPDDWSVKGDDRVRRPHLTSVDAVVMAVETVPTLPTTIAAVVTPSDISHATADASPV